MSPLLFDGPIPSSLVIRKSLIPNAGLGVFAVAKIFKGTVLGDYTGIEVDEEADGDYVLAIQGYNHKGKEVFMSIDAQDPTTSGWPRYLNSVKQIKDVNKNCKFFINRNKISVQTLRDIDANEELLVYYGDEYTTF
jgi:SET domain-containing protein